VKRGLNHVLKKKYRGVAVVTALLLTTLAVTIVASLFWQQQVQVRSIENQRLQLQQQWVLRGALDWARLILREDGRNSVIDDLNEPWSTPLAPIQLDQYIESGTSGSGVGNAVLSGSIQDAQGFFNLNNLATQGNVNAPEVQVFARLLSLVRQDTSLANVASKHIAMIYDMANKPPSTLPRPISLVQIDDLLSVLYAEGDRCNPTLHTGFTNQHTHKCEHSATRVTVCADTRIVVASGNGDHQQSTTIPIHERC
jgi:general secretion pathway protein K